MVEGSHTETQSDRLLAEVAQLRQELAHVKRINSDLEISLLTITEHGDVVEAELRESNQRLQEEIAERKLAQSTLQEILETVSRDKADLELLLEATVEHGDMLEYQLYTEAVQTMRQSEELFRVISEATPVLMLLTQQADGVITYANSSSSQQFGIDASQINGRRLDEFFADPVESQRLQDIFASQGFVRNYEMQMKGENDTQFWVSASMHPVMLRGEPRLLITLYDISDRKQAEAALRHSQAQLQDQAEELERRVEQRTAELKQAEEKYRSIFENAAEGLFQVDVEGHYLSANPTLAEILGYASANELMANVTNVGNLYAHSRRRDEMLAYLKRFDSLSNFESQVKRKNGTIIWISESIRVTKDVEGGVLYYEGSVHDITDRKSTEEELHRQRQATERLLLNVLPQPVAERLKRGHKNIADNFAEATVLFADIANFTGISSGSSPSDLVNLLNSIFSTFDTLADQHHLEKIKTIGDAYMVVGGLPKPRADHIRAIANMALDMQREIRQFRTWDNQPITLRIGIHTGPVVAGVIGTRKFIYDLWGDTVNVASRMESHGESGQIQVTAEVYEKLKTLYSFEERGAIEVKGKGEMLTYWLLGKK